MIEWPKVPDVEMEHYANKYRSECGSNDVMMRNGRVILFENYLAMNLLADSVSIGRTGITIAGVAVR